MQAPRVRLEAIGVVVERHGRQVLDLPLLTLLADELLAIIGPNGAGKSTILQVLGLLQPVRQGTIRLDGQLVQGRAETLTARRRMAMVFQEPLLFDTSVAENVASGLRIRGLGRAEIGQRVDYWLAALGIKHLSRRPARALSGGEAQRVSLARALALDPDILLLDEPFAALDATTRASLVDDVERLLRRPGRVVVVVTHDRTEALRLGDRVAVVLDGRIAQLDRPPIVFGNPANEAVAAFVGVETILPGEVVAATEGLLTVRVGSQQVVTPGDFAIGRRVLVCLRPEDIALTVPLATIGGGTSVRNHFVGVIERLIPAGALVRVELLCEGLPLSALITRPSAEELALAPGRSVVASVKASAVHLIPSERQEGR